MKELVKDLKNKKGFTLVELLAVIVVLAIIILIAMPAVMSAMDKARRNALVTEANEITKIAQTAFADKQMSASGLTDACFDINWLITEGYMDKKKDGYSGYVTITLNVNDGKYLYDKRIKISNGIYKYDGDPGDAQAGQLQTGDKIDDICAGYTETSGYKQVFK